MATDRCNKRDFLSCKHQVEQTNNVGCGCLLRDYIPVPESYAFCLKFLVWEKKKKAEHCKFAEWLQKIVRIFVLSIHSSHWLEKRIVIAMLGLCLAVKNKYKLLLALFLVAVLLVVVYMINKSLLLIAILLLPIVYAQFAKVLNEIRECYRIDVCHSTAVECFLDKRLSFISDNNELFETMHLLRNILLGKYGIVSIDELEEVERDKVQCVVESILKTNAKQRKSKGDSQSESKQKIIVLIQKRNMDGFNILQLDSL